MHPAHDIHGLAAEGAYARPVRRSISPLFYKYFTTFPPRPLGFSPIPRYIEMLNDFEFVWNLVLGASDFVM